MPSFGTGQNKHIENKSERRMLCLGELVQRVESCKTGVGTRVHQCSVFPVPTLVLPHFWTFLQTVFFRVTVQGASSFPTPLFTPLFLLSALYSVKQNLQWLANLAAALFFFFFFPSCLPVVCSQPVAVLCSVFALTDLQPQFMRILVWELPANP